MHPRDVAHRLERGNRVSALAAWPQWQGLTAMCSKYPSDASPFSVEHAGANLVVDAVREALGG